MRVLIVFLCLFIFMSCNYFKLQDKDENTSEIIAIANTEKLFKKDLEGVFPENLSEQDSLVLLKSYVQKWAIKQLLLNKAEKNSSLEAINQINGLVKDYKESLLINNYKEQLIKQQLDTVISEEEIEKYYAINKENFKLNEELVKAKYLHFNTNLKNEKELIELFKSDNIEDLEALQKQELSFKIHQFNDSTWTQLDNILLKLPFSKQNLLNKSKFIKKQDSLGLYLVAVNDVLLRNSIAPLSYIKPTIKQMILHKRKIELIRKIEKIIVKDATQNNNFKTF